MSKRAKLNTIRIIGGQWRGRRLPVIESQGLRPTINRVRETLFNWLMHDIVNARCLDLFAGSGALGLESISRGAKFVHFNEVNKTIADQLEQNLDLLLNSERFNRADVGCTSALTVLAAAQTDPYDIVYLDPPFESDLLEKSIRLLVENNWITSGSIIYLEQDVNRKIVEVPSNWKLHREGVAGQSAYNLYIS